MDWKILNKEQRTLLQQNNKFMSIKHDVITCLVETSSQAESALVWIVSSQVSIGYEHYFWWPKLDNGASLTTQSCWGILVGYHSRSRPVGAGPTSPVCLETTTFHCKTHKFDGWQIWRNSRPSSLEILRCPMKTVTTRANVTACLKNCSVVKWWNVHGSEWTGGIKRRRIMSSRNCIPDKFTWMTTLGVLWCSVIPPHTIPLPQTNEVGWTTHASAWRSNRRR